MTEQLKYRYMEMALALQHIHLKLSDIEKVIKTYELITAKGGDANVKDIASISASVDAKDKLDF